MAFVTNKKTFLDSLKAMDGESRRRFAKRVVDVIWTLHHEIVANTPVWSGSAVANYRWSIGIPDYGYVEPIDNGPPGPTNSMPLGTEPRRRPNEELAYESLEALTFSDPYRVFWLNNNDPDIFGIEFGSLPPPPLTIRNPQGMIGLSLEFVYAKLQAGQI
jgi:hypothetical protein